MGSDSGQADERHATHRVWVDGFEMAIDPVTRGGVRTLPGGDWSAICRGTGVRLPSRRTICRWWG